MIQITCAHCGSESDKPAGHVNRSRRQGLNVYCNRQCAGLARRNRKSDAQKKAEKAEYDREYRRKNVAKLKAKKREYHQRTYDPAKAAEHRKTRMAAHVEYCRQPRYRAWKRKYDRKHRAKKKYGDFAEAFLTLQELEQECLSLASRYEIGLENRTINKAQKRKREHVKSISNQPEIGPLGDATGC